MSYRLNTPEHMSLSIGEGSVSRLVSDDMVIFFDFSGDDYTVTLTQDGDYTYTGTSLGTAKDEFDKALVDPEQFKADHS